MKGLEGIPIITAPMAANLDDLSEFWKRVVLCEPWQYDHTVRSPPFLLALTVGLIINSLRPPIQCIPLPWRPINLQDEGRKLKWGVMWDDGMQSLYLISGGECSKPITVYAGAIPPTPACRRALSTVAAALRKQGHEVVDL